MPFVQPGVARFVPPGRVDPEHEAPSIRTSTTAAETARYPAKRTPELADLLRTYSPRLQRFAESLLRSSPTVVSDAEDIVAEVIARAYYKGLDHVRMPKPDAYLFKSVRRQVKTYHKKEDRELKRDTRYQLSRNRLRADLGPEELAVANDTHEQIKKARQGLKTREQTAVFFKFDEYRSNVDIGELMGLTPQRVGQILAEAMVRLRAMPQIRGLEDG